MISLFVILINFLCHNQFIIPTLFNNYPAFIPVLSKHYEGHVFIEEIFKSNLRFDSFLPLQVKRYKNLFVKC